MDSLRKAVREELKIEQDIVNYQYEIEKIRALIKEASDQLKKVKENSNVIFKKNTGVYYQNQYGISPTKGPKIAAKSSVCGVRDCKFTSNPSGISQHRKHCKGPAPSCSKCFKTFKNPFKQRDHNQKCQVYSTSEIVINNSSFSGLDSIAAAAAVASSAAVNEDKDIIDGPDAGEITFTSSY